MMTETKTLILLHYIGLPDIRALLTISFSRLITYQHIRHHHILFSTMCVVCATKLYVSLIFPLFFLHLTLTL